MHRVTPLTSRALFSLVGLGLGHVTCPDRSQLTAAPISMLPRIMALPSCVCGEGGIASPRVPGFCSQDRAPQMLSFFLSEKPHGGSAVEHSLPCPRRIFTKLTAALESQHFEAEELPGTASKRWKLTSSEQGVHRGSSGLPTLSSFADDPVGKRLHNLLTPSWAK